MTYFEGFVVPVPEANREAYYKHASEFAPMFQDIGVTRTVETWDSDVPEGKVTDFRKAVVPSPTRRSSSPGSNIRTVQRATRRTRR